MVRSTSGIQPTYSESHAGGGWLFRQKNDSTWPQESQL